MGMRGNFEEQYSGDHHLGTYIAGVWYPDKTRVGWWKNGYPDYFGKVINAVNFIAMDLFVNDQLVDLAKISPSDFRLELDMETGILRRNFTVTLAGATVKFSFERFLSIVKRELALIKMDAEIIEGDAEIKVVSKLDNNVHNEDSNYDERFWEELAHGQTETFHYLTTRTVENNFDIERFTVTSAMRHSQTPIDSVKSELCVADTFAFSGTAGDTFSLIKEVLIVTSRDVPAHDHPAKSPN